MTWSVMRGGILLVLIWRCYADALSKYDVISPAYHDEWVVRIEGGPNVAALLAMQSGYIHVGSMLGFTDTYIWRKGKSTTLNKRKNSGEIILNSISSSKISWAEYQHTIVRHKRDYITTFDSNTPLIRDKRLPPNIFYSDDRNIGNAKIADDSNDIDEINFNDELWDQEWYLKNTRSIKSLLKLDLNVIPVYRLGITGKGVRIAVLDDGLEYTHDDLRNNYDPEISYDVNNKDDDPLPRYESTGANGHGTRCAGEIAMEADNRKCGVGVAFEASIGGIKLLDGVVNDRIEGEALGYKSHLVDIYTASWGPADDGKSLEAPGKLATEAIENGIKKGRGGKGSIYVWASGNGGATFDDCGCDGYVGSIYTIAIGSASQNGKFPWYGEICPSTLATTYSSGAYYDRMIMTTNLKNTCTTRHTGTSASAPLAAGIIALALEVNSDLSWRDIQHLIVSTSEYSPLRQNPGWVKNAAGFWFNPRFGYGLLNAHGLVLASYNWTTVPEKIIQEYTDVHTSDRILGYGSSKYLKFEVRNNGIHFLEHVQVETNIEYSFRGSLQMYLTAPSGTRVQILRSRKLDVSNNGFSRWIFMSIGTWGEDPRGTWVLEIYDEVGPKENNGTLGNFTLILHGTKEMPVYRTYGPRVYNDEYNFVTKLNKDAANYEETMHNLETELHQRFTAKREKFIAKSKENLLLQEIFT